MRGIVLLMVILCLWATSADARTADRIDFSRADINNGELDVLYGGTDLWDGSKVIVIDPSTAQFSGVGATGLDRDSGSYESRWNGHDDTAIPLASGVYLYRLAVTTDRRTVIQSRKMTSPK